MKRKIPIERGLSRRKKALLVMLAVTGVISVLLYYEQIAVIYVLATLGLVILLLAVAFADLEKVGLGGENVETADVSPAENEAKTVAAEDQFSQEAGQSKRTAA